jgi:Aspartyl protease
MKEPFGIAPFVLGRFLLLSALLCWALQLRAQSAQDQNVFVDKEGRTSFPIELRQGLVMVPVSIHGSRSLRFVLDTGSTRTLVDKSLASSLGLKEGEASSLQGAGAGRVPIHALPGVDLQLPGLESRNYQCFTADLAPLEQSLGVKEDGILGYEFFSRFAVTVDFEARRMTVQLPSTFHPGSGFEALPLEIRGKWPFVKGELSFPGAASVEDSFFIDSGSSDAVDHPVVKTLQAKKSTTTGVGLGSPVAGALAVATYFRIGSFTVNGPTVACCGATDATSRLIGTDVLRRFTVIFDYQSSRLFLRPNQSLQKQTP